MLRIHPISLLFLLGATKVCMTNLTWRLGAHFKVYDRETFFLIILMLVTLLTLVQYVYHKKVFSQLGSRTKVGFHFSNLLLRYPFLVSLFKDGGLLL